MSHNLPTVTDRTSLTYFDILLGEISDFEKLLTDDSARDDIKKESFIRLMTLTLGSDTDWRRARAVSDELGISFCSVQRYALRRSAPQPLLYKPIVEVVRTIISQDYDQLLPVIEAQESDDQKRRADSQKQWDRLVQRIENIVPDQFYNCPTTYPELPDRDHSSDSVDTHICFSYPCRGIYDFCSHAPTICEACYESKDCAVHGRVFLMGEDGFLMLPHIIFTRADVLQLLSDLETYENLTLPRGQKMNEWLSELEEFVHRDQFFDQLPPGCASAAVSHDLGVAQIPWIL